MRALALLTLSLAGCSLTGVSEFDIPKCTSNAQCNVVNEHEGIAADACQVYQCRSDGIGCELRDRDFDDDGYLSQNCAAQVSDPLRLDCDDNVYVAHPGGSEKCDGIDNDCNGIIDDELGQPLSKTATLPASDTVTFSDGYAHTPSIALAQGPTARVSAVESDSPETMPPELLFAYVSKQDAPDTELDGQAAPGECPEFNGSSQPTLERCVLAQLASTRVSDADGAELGQIVAAINTNGCAHGQVRIGHVNDADEIVLHGPEVQSNIYYGVAVDETGCTGATRASGPGATAINIAGLARDNALPQALVTWIGASHKTHECGTAAPVEALGVWLEHSDPEPERHRWVNAANDGTPEVLGVTAGRGRPALAALEGDEGAGYLVAYGAAAGGIALHFLPPFADPPEYHLRQSELRQLPAVGLGMSASLAAGAHADELSMAIGPRDGAELEIALVWLSGECGTARNVMLTRARVDLDNGALFELGSTVVAEKASERAPSAVFAPSGFVTASYGTDGGYLVAWTDNDHQVHLARVLSATDQVVGTPIIVATDAGSEPLLYRNGRTRIAVYGTSGEVSSGPAQCEPQDVEP